MNGASGTTQWRWHFSVPHGNIECEGGADGRHPRQLRQARHPKAVREALGLGPGSTLEVDTKDEALVLRPGAGADLVEEEGVLVFTGEAAGISKVPSRATGAND